MKSVCREINYRIFLDKQRISLLIIGYTELLTVFSSDFCEKLIFQSVTT